MGIFEELKTEADVVRLKKRIARDPLLREQLAAVRGKALYTKGGSRRIDAFMMPSTAELRQLYEYLVRDGVESANPLVDQLLRKMRTKSNSGVAVVSILTKPYACPGRCTYCPNDVRMPKSYLADEPAAARALANEFDAYRQVTTRLAALVANGHPVDKIEMIVIGGTWSFYHPVYQEEFLIGAYRACNDWATGNDSRTEQYEDMRAYITLLQSRNETAHARVIGLSIETRPDYITDFEIARMRMLGVTKVEMGVQHLDDAVLQKTKRDMKIERVITATERLRDAGFKLVYHMMPNLPGSTPERDVSMFADLFSGKDFQPDMLKIYPCMVLKTTELYDEYLRGEFRPYTDGELAKVLIGAKKAVPHYVRIQRVVRDIPAGHIEAGSKISNLREVIAQDMHEHGWYCKCIRCREVRESEVCADDYELIERGFETTHGKEYFLSFEKDDPLGGKLASFTRLRIPNDFGSAPLPELLGAALIRELHTYGQHTRVGAEGTQSQHVGFGRRLIARAEEIAREHGAKKLAIIAGVGVRKYYEKLGYYLEGTYMVKEL
ncbi:MAG TPA: tRNA uridine(34) 5-carboxymethylaminomethyl modification radical SAM/GNAT enzyme Elp3 [Candidatus Paceibacterota bacterium]|nr:tRNA uridine(34) 5-carboxymethylaminomethyl modification radical SAM/GNAT enzyme Elp3 [Candidatus Paceibacterota bacterium]